MNERGVIVFVVDVNPLKHKSQATGAFDIDATGADVWRGENLW